MCFFFPFLSVQMDELTKLLSYKINQLANHSPQEEAMRSSQQRALTPQEVQKKNNNNYKRLHSQVQKKSVLCHWWRLKISLGITSVTYTDDQKGSDNKQVI